MAVTHNPEELSVALASRIRDARAQRDLNQKDFGALGGVGITTQQQYEAGRTAPSSEYFFRLAEHGIVIPLIDDLKSGLSSSTTGEDLRTELRRSLKPTEVERLDLVAVHEIDLAYGLGASFADGTINTRVHHFPRKWIEQITGTPPELLTIARGRGDSMMPTLLDGDMVIVDRSNRTMHEQDAIWALTVGQMAMIKRLRVRGDRVVILSDNDRVPPEEVFHEEVSLVGRVIFIGRRI